MTLALGLVLAGCSGPSDPTSQSTSTPAESATQTDATAAPSDAGTESPTPTEAAPTQAELPDFMAPYEGAEVISSSRAQAESGTLDQVSIVMRAEAEPDDIVKSYTEKLEQAGFETFGDGSLTKAAQVVNFRHKDNDGMLVLTVSDDPADPKASIVSLGGTIAP